VGSGVVLLVVVATWASAVTGIVVVVKMWTTWQFTNRDRIAWTVPILLVLALPIWTGPIVQRRRSSTRLATTAA